MTHPNNLIISIVAPVYGVEKYIGKWLDSVFDQDIPETDYEVICVNDCTKDRSAEIIRKYQQNHPNLRLIEHPVNKKTMRHAILVFVRQWGSTSGSMIRMM